MKSCYVFNLVLGKKCKNLSKNAKFSAIFEIFSNFIMRFIEKNIFKEYE